jgi:hypothetical protein
MTLTHQVKSALIRYSENFVGAPFRLLAWQQVLRFPDSHALHFPVQVTAFDTNLGCCRGYVPVVFLKLAGQILAFKASARLLQRKTQIGIGLPPPCSAGSENRPAGLS